MKVEDELQVCSVNTPPMIDIANSLVQFVRDIDYTCEKILRPIYKEMY
jgi:hypothetical protein